MSLPRKDVRLKISPEAHAALVALAEFHEKDISEFGALLFEKTLVGELHVMKIQAERMARWGKRGNSGESEGLTGRRGFLSPIRAAK